MQMMIADAPRYVSAKKVKRGKPIETEEDINEFLEA